MGIGGAVVVAEVDCADLVGFEEVEAGFLGLGGVALVPDEDVGYVEE